MLKSLLKPEAKKGLQTAVGHELYASNLYKSLANQMQRVGYFGTQSYFTKESADELVHYQILADYMNDRGDMADIPTIEAITDKATTIADALQISLEAEMDLGDFYQELYDKLEDGGDCVTAQFLLQFIEIQRKSIGEVMDLITRLQRCGSNESAILEFDEYLGEK